MDILLNHCCFLIAVMSFAGGDGLSPIPRAGAHEIREEGEGLLMFLHMIVIK